LKLDENLFIHLKYTIHLKTQQEMWREGKMRRRNVLWMFIVTLVATAIVSRVAVAQEFTVVTAPTFSDLNLTPGLEFSIDITITNVQNLWGYQYVLNYNTSILTATNFTNYILPDDFDVLAGESWIDDTKGEVVVAVSSYYGAKTGFSTVETQPLTKIDFEVDGLGTTVLDISDSAFVDVYANAIKPPYNLIEADGKFSNTELLEVHDIAVSGVSASPTEVTAGESVTVSVTVENQGDFTETFTVTAYANETQIGEPQTVTDLAADASTSLTFTWDTTDVDGGVYVMRADATVPDEDDPADNVLSGDAVTVKGGGGGLAFDMYIIGGVVLVVIVVAVAVYALRARK